MLALPEVAFQRIAGTILPRRIRFVGMVNGSIAVAEGTIVRIHAHVHGVQWAGNAVTSLTLIFGFEVGRRIAQHTGRASITRIQRPSPGCATAHV